MSSKRKRHSSPNLKDKSQGMSLGKWLKPESPVRKSFEGPKGVKVFLRVTFTRKAYADIVAHAKESLDAEICGVLAGEVCTDEEGLFVSVRVAIKGTSARQGRGHVTFTQDTWSLIHQTLDADYPGLHIVGWYHSHPGFGVEISDMDRFVHQNFFPTETQVALITDPLGGEVAVFVNTAQGITAIDCFWIEGREHRCRVFKSPPNSLQGTFSLPESTEKVLEDMSNRLSQVTQAVDDYHTMFHRFLLTVGMVVCVLVASAIGYAIYTGVNARLEPPRPLQFTPVPVQIDNKTVLLGVTVVSWEIPPELNAVYLQMEQMKRDAEAKAQTETDKQASAKETGASKSSPTAGPSRTFK